MVHYWIPRQLFTWIVILLSNCIPIKGFDINISDIKKVYDFVIIGGGSGGAVVANRLSEVRDWKVLVLEAGDIENPLADIPIIAPGLLGTGYNWKFKAKRNDQECLRFDGLTCLIHAGQGLGGTSLMNWLVFIRGNRYDYDEWESLGNPGWKFDDVLPYFKKLESTKIDVKINRKFRGTKGPITVENPKYQSGIIKPFLEASNYFGYNVTDPNSYDQLGFSKVQASTINGHRDSSARAYLYPAMKRTNLDLSLNSWVTKILIDSTTLRVIGVEFVKNKLRQFVKVTKEVILSAGAIKSPQILMLSGIGPHKHLKTFGIPIIKNLNVGYNYQDHVTMPFLTFLVNSSSVVLSMQSVMNPINIAEYMLNRRGPLTLPAGVEGIAFIKTNVSYTSTKDSDIEIVMNPTGMNMIDLNLFSFGTGVDRESLQQYFKGIINKPAFSLTPVLMNPKSRGRIRLKSKNPFKWPDITRNSFGDKNDLTVLIEGIQKTIDIGLSQPFKQYNTKLWSKHLPGCQNHSFNSNKYWECSLRSYAFTLQHHSGTCKMGPITDSEAVVNHKLLVHGVKGLRVVDASIFPTIPSAHTNAVVYMVAEKASDMIKFKWLGF